MLSSRHPGKYLHVVPTYLPATRYGGPIYSVHGVCRGLAALGYEVHVYTTNVDGPGVSNVPISQPVVLDGVRVWYFRTAAGRRLYRSPQMGRALRDTVQQFDLVHLHSVFLWPTAVGARIAARAGVPYLLSPRGMLVDDLIKRKSRILKTAWIELFERWNVEHASAIHVTANVEAQNLKAFGFALPPVWVVPNGVDPPVPADARLISEDVRRLTAQGSYILSLGRLNWKKNLPELIRAFSYVDGSHLVIAGNSEDGYGNELKTLVCELNLGYRVTVLDRAILGADKEYLYSSCHAFVLASISENFGNVALEAMVRGKPVVVSRHAGAAAIVEEVGCGIVVEPDARGLAAAIDQLVANPQLAQEMGGRGAAAVEARFSWIEIARQMSEIYGYVVGDGRAARKGTRTISRSRESYVQRQL
jgi:glycosyltransferase involved in cell wall biosynthesis